MDSIPSLESVIGSGIQALDTDDWSPVSANFPDELRLPKKRRYLGEDMSSHSWDTRGTLSTDPPTPFIMEQQELVDENAQHNDMVPYYATLSQRTVFTHSSGSRVGLKVVSTPKHQAINDGSPTSAAARVRWTEEDDKILINLVCELGHNWPLIASRMDGRTSKQVKERWTNQLDPSISTEPWTSEDDNQLVILIRELGHSWCEIARRMKGRTESMVKNRFHANLRKRFGNHIFDPSVPLPPLQFKPKSVKTKKTVISEEVRAAAAHAAHKAAQIATTKSSVSDSASVTSRSGGSSRGGLKRTAATTAALPEPSSFGLPSTFYDDPDSDVIPAHLM